MDYGRIVSRSFEIAWQHKWLWIFGMFAAGTGFNLKFEYLIGTSPTNPFDFSNNTFIDPNAIIALYAGLIPILIIMGLMIIFAKGAIIDSVNRIERGGTYSFSTAFSAGIDFFLRFIGLGIIFFVVWIAYMLIAFIIIAISSYIHVALAIIVGFIGFFISFIFFIGLTQVMNLAQRVVVIRDSGIMDSISEGVQLVKMHFGKNIAAFFIVFAFTILFGISSMIIWLALNFPIDSVIQGLNLNSFLAMFAALILGLPVSFVLAGLIGLFSESFMTLFYIELVEPKEETVYSQQTPEQGNNPPMI